MIRLLALALLAGSAAAHPSHVALAEVHHRPARGVLEVAFYASLHDLEAVLPKLDDAHAAAYFANTFVVTGADGKARPLRWVGIEAKVHEAWLYFEVPLAALPGSRLRCTVLFEGSTKQVDTVNLHAGGVVRSLLFTPQADEQPLSPPKRAGGGAAAP